MRERGFLPELSPAAIAQAEQLTQPASDQDPALRDLRQLLWCSIDNDDSRDLDQLSVAESLPDGVVKILVAVADVDALVTQGSAIDQHARQNTTSVYTPAQIFPMLPEKLSTDLTSLNEDAERLAVVVEMIIDPEGKLVASEVYRARVCNQAKLAYNSVAAWLDGTKPAPPRVATVPGLADQLRLQDRVAQRLKQLRRQSGALSLETLEARPVFSDNILTHFAVEQRNRAKELIEDFMIAANGVTARYLASKGLPSFPAGPAHPSTLGTDRGIGDRGGRALACHPG